VDHFHIDPHHNFTDAEYALVGALFKRLIDRGVAPIVLFALNDDGRPCAMFNGAFSQADADEIGNRITDALEAVHPD
jgi:hypothetical protein